MTYLTLVQRRFERRRRVAVVLLVAAACTIAAPACMPGGGWPHTSSHFVGTSVSEARFARLRRGVNLGQWFAQQLPDSARVDLATGSVTHDDLRRIRALGFGHVRVPVDPGPLYHESDPSRVDGPYLASLDRAVDAILDADLAVIVDIHAVEGGAFKKRLKVIRLDDVTRYRLRRRSDGSVIPTLFDEKNLRFFSSSFVEPS